MDYLTWKIIHLTGLALTFMGLAGILAVNLAGGGVVKRRFVFHLSHGIGLLLLLVSGFGLAAKLGIRFPPGWMQGKLVIWLLAGGSMVLAVRFSRRAGTILAFFALLVFAAAWLALKKPF